MRPVEYPVESVYQDQTAQTCNLILMCTFSFSTDSFNPSPEMPILGSYNSVANKDMTSEIWENGDTII